VSTTGLQFNIASQRRQRGKEEEYSSLLVELDGSSAWDVDMAVRSEQRDQGNQDACEERDPALKVERLCRSADSACPDLRELQLESRSSQERTPLPGSLHAGHLGVTHLPLNQEPT
jgi:hypothetical protein